MIGPMPDNAALAESRRHAVSSIGTSRPLRGLALALFGALLLLVARDRFWLLAGAFSGFLLMAPVLATGLYAVSRALERGERPTVSTALRCWIPRDHRMLVFGVLL